MTVTVTHHRRDPMIIESSLASRWLRDHPRPAAGPAAWACQAGPTQLYKYNLNFNYFKSFMTRDWLIKNI